jgi:ribosome-binding factor A
VKIKYLFVYSSIIKEIRVMRTIKDEELKPGMIIADVNVNGGGVLPCYFEVMKIDNEERKTYLKFIKHPKGTVVSDYYEGEDGLTKFNFQEEDGWYLVEDENN